MPLAVHARMLTSSDGCQIYADAVGDPSKPCLLFIHGFTLSAAVFDNIFLDSRYSSDFFLVRYDVRGHGRSGKPDTIEEYTSRLYADDFATVLRAFRLRRPVVVAWSLGATVIADVAANLPADTMAGVVYIAPCPYIGPIMQVIGTPFILDLLTTIATTDDATTVSEKMQSFFNSCFNDPNAIPWETRALWQGMATFQQPQHRRFALSRSQDPACLLELGSQGLPLLVLIGTNDPQIVAKSLEKEIVSAFSNVDFCTLEGAGHSPHFENKEEVMSRITSFTHKLTVKQKKIPNGVSRVGKGSTSFRASQRVVRDIVC